MKDINKLKKSDTQKIQLRIANNLVSFIDNDEEQAMHSKNDKIKIMIHDEPGKLKRKFLIHLKIAIKII